MRLLPVDSSAVSRVGYDKPRRLLAVEYKGGGLYEYSKVTPQEWEALLDSESIGRYVNYVIKPIHPFRVLAPRLAGPSHRPRTGPRRG